MNQVFISHAHEDKAEVAKPIAEELSSKGVKVWYDEYELKIGDSLRKSIDQGLKGSDFGVVIFSPSFFKKNWTQYELDSLITLESLYSRKIILPVWHNLSKEDLLNYSPALADKVATSTSKGLDNVVSDIMNAIGIKQESPMSFYNINSDNSILLHWGRWYNGGSRENIKLYTIDTKPTWHLRASDEKYTGVNLLNLPMKGTVRFEYLIKSINENHPNIIFFMIPMKRSRKLVEVGFEKPTDPKNPYSVFRERMRVKSEVNVWHQVEFNYNFEDLSGTDYAIFAPRINEGSPFPGKGELLIRNVIVDS